MSADTACVIYDNPFVHMGGFIHETYSVSTPSFAWGRQHFPELTQAIHWHNENCDSEYGLSIRMKRKEEEPMTDTFVVETYVRKPFEVQAIKVQEDNLVAIAKWCGGKVGETRSGAPFVELPTGKSAKLNHNRAFVGYWVVTAKGGFFASYSDRTFTRTFEGR